MIFSIATWNVNSLRVRLPHVQAWLGTSKPDVLALQEIKVTEADFPYDEIKAAGYQAVVSGQRTYNGVALLTRQPARDVLTDIPGLEDTQRRVLAATIGDVRVINLYVPNGESVNSEKYQYKLNWLKHLHAWLKDEIKQHPKLVVLGDFNIAPHNIDVYNPKAWEGQVLFSPPEREAFQGLLRLGLFDVFRVVHSDLQAFSWWDYRMNAYKRKMGLRIDHILATEPLVKNCERCIIDENPRALERPSDHAPVAARFI
ncbi:MAG TPA: exodeoxyribonuclease III [Gammaproteobacteria bacterium]|nr:exodeoxyribonuclease III [Gammaproteobacteria bacterium]